MNLFQFLRFDQHGGGQRGSKQVNRTETKSVFGRRVASRAAWLAAAADMKARFPSAHTFLLRFSLIHRGKTKDELEHPSDPQCLVACDLPDPILTRVQTEPTSSTTWKKTERNEAPR